VFMLRSLARARFGHAQAIAWPTAVRCNFICGEDFRLQSRLTRRYRGATDAYRLRDDERMPVICPTCQIALSDAGGPCYFAWGCFRYFWERAPEREFFNVTRSYPPDKLPVNPGINARDARSGTQRAEISNGGGRPNIAARAIIRSATHAHCLIVSGRPATET
jgi:hypothetical protein